VRALIAIAATAVLAGAADTATLADAGVPRPVITKVAPMRVKVGGTITVRGRHFSSRRSRDTVVFKAKNGRVALGRVTHASESKLVLRVPGAVEGVLTKKASVPTPTRMYLRVVADHYGHLSKLRHSPVVVSAQPVPDPLPY
jgi:hypothetical protein